MSKSYKNPPIQEAICQFRFSDNQNWQSIMPGLIYENVKNEFPHTEDSPDLDYEQNDTSKSVKSIKRTRLYNEDRNIFIQISPDFLSINHKRPYTSWEKFSPLIQKSLSNYLDIAKPKELIFVSLRYINHFSFSEDELSTLESLNNFFTFRPFVESSTLQGYTKFITGISIPFEGDKSHLTLTLQTMRSKKKETENLSIGLDIDYHSHFIDGQLEFEKFPALLETAHERIEEAFEESINDSLREHFSR